MARVDAEWRGVLNDAFTRALRDEYGIDDDFPPDAMVALVMTMAQGFVLERLSGIGTGHEALLGWIDGWLASQHAERASGGKS